MKSVWFHYVNQVLFSAEPPDNPVCSRRVSSFAMPVAESQNLLNILLKIVSAESLTHIAVAITSTGCVNMTSQTGTALLEICDGHACIASQRGCNMQPSASIRQSKGGSWAHACCPEGLNWLLPHDKPVGNHGVVFCHQHNP